MVFVKYVYLNDFIEELLFCFRVEKTTKAVDIFEKFLLSSYQKIFCGKTCMGAAQTEPQLCCEPNLDFKLMLKSKIQAEKAFIVWIHRHALASKTLLPPLREVLDQTIRMVNFVKGGAFNSRLLKQLCIDIDADHYVLLFDTNTR